MCAVHAKWSLVIAVALACAACAPAIEQTAPPPPPKVEPVREPPREPPPPPPPVAAPARTPAEQAFDRGVRNYEDANYKDAAKEFQSALDTGLAKKGDQVQAHKYLAFIACISGRNKVCRDEFKKALDIDPSFDLAPAEAGHPKWGPVFRSVKAKPATPPKPATPQQSPAPQKKS
jgi:Tfp pilus assembly protein PilF